MALIKKLLLLACTSLVLMALLEVWFRSRSELELGFRYENGEFLAPKEFEMNPPAGPWTLENLQLEPEAPDLTRVLLLGDSYVESYSVEADQGLGPRLEHYLNQGHGRHEVVAVGRHGWGQRHELRALRRLGPGVKPDLVITVFLALNDVRNNFASLQAKAEKQISEMPRARPGWSLIKREDAPLLLLEGSALNRVLSYRLAMLRAGGDLEIPIDYLVYAVEYPPEWEQAFEVTRGLLRETQQVAASLGARYAIVSASTPQGLLGPVDGLELLVTTYPGMADRRFDLEQPDRRLAEFCKQEQIPFLALEPIFAQLTLEQGQALHWKHDGHWNVEGHDQAGRVIASFIREQGLVGD